MAALIVVDLQRDFLSGGALPVPGVEALIPRVNQIMREAAARGAFVVVTQDWHPADHVSFSTSHPGAAPGDTVPVRVDGDAALRLFPPHCVARSSGAELAPGLDTSLADVIVRKGEDPGVESFSAFHDMARRRSTGLAQMLRERSVRSVAVAAEFCVAATAVDALEEGFSAAVLLDAVAAVDAEAGQAALAEVAAKGGRLLTWDELRPQLDRLAPG